MYEFFKFFLNLTDFSELLGEIDPFASEQALFNVLVLRAVVEDLLDLALQPPHLNVDYLLPQRVRGDGQHALQAPEQHNVIAVDAVLGKALLVVVVEVAAVAAHAQLLVQKVLLVDERPRLFDELLIHVDFLRLQILFDRGYFVVF